jgi:hypothetical protein
MGAGGFGGAAAASILGMVAATGGAAGGADGLTAAGATGTGAGFAGATGAAGRCAMGATGFGGSGFAASGAEVFWIAFSTSPGLEIFERSILGLNSSAVVFARGLSLAAASLLLKCLRTFSAASGSMELE